MQGNHLSNPQHGTFASLDTLLSCMADFGHEMQVERFKDILSNTFW